MLAWIMNLDFAASGVVLTASRCAAIPSNISTATITADFDTTIEANIITTIEGEELCQPG